MATLNSFDWIAMLLDVLLAVIALLLMELLKGKTPKSDPYTSEKGTINEAYHHLKIAR